MHRAELLEEIAGRYGVAAEYPWRRYPQYAVFRHAGNRKWFAVLMNPPGRKLGLATEEEIRRIVTIFRELRAGLTADKKTKLKSPSGTLSTAEAISVVNNGMALSGYFGDGALKADDLIAGILGAVVKDPMQDKIVWQEYLDTVVKQRDGWQDLYRAARDMS